jgi:hypothetical protein
MDGESDTRVGDLYFFAYIRCSKVAIRNTKKSKAGCLDSAKAGLLKYAVFFSTQFESVCA